MVVMEYIKKVRVSEANVQAELYRRLKMQNIECELEYKIRRPGERGARLDCVIIQGNMIPLIIEVKNHIDPEKTRREWHQKKQYTRYSRYGVPVLICAAMCHIDAIVDHVIKVLNSGPSSPSPS